MLKKYSNELVEFIKTLTPEERKRFLAMATSHTQALVASSRAKEAKK